MASLEPFLVVLHSLVAFGLIGLAAFGIGRPIVRQLHLAKDALATGVWSLTLGLVGGGTLIALLGSIGCLSAPAVGAVTLAGVLWAMVELACVKLGEGRTSKAQLRRHLASGKSPALGNPRSLLVMIPAGIVLLAGFITALVPPLSADAFTSSLEVSKRGLETHGFAAAASAEPEPGAPGSARENLTRIWFLWAFALEGPVAARLVHWGLGLLAALAAVVVARSLLARETAWLAGGFVAICPGFAEQLGAPREELAVVLLATLSLAAIVQIVLHGDSTRTAVAGGLVLAGAIAASPVGLLLAGAVGGALAIEIWARREMRRELSTSAGVLFGTAILAAAPWLCLSQTWNLPAAAIQSPRSAVAHLGPVIICALSAMAVVRRLRGMSLLLRVTGLSAVLAVTVTARDGWWAMLIGPACVIAVWMWQELSTLPSHARIAMTLILGALMAISPWDTCMLAVDSLPVACGWHSRDEYLLAREPTYRAASLVNRIARPGDRLYCQDDRTFYFSRAPASPAGTFGQAHADARKAVGWAAAAGFSYIVLAETLSDDSNAAAAVSPGAISADSDGAFQELTPACEVIPILEYLFADDNNRYIRYRLLKLRGAAIEQAQSGPRQLN